MTSRAPPRRTGWARSSDAAPAARGGAPASGATAAPGGASSESTAVLPAHVDLHARPAAQFVRMAMGFRSRIQVAAGEREVDAKSLLSVLSLGAKGGTALRLRADGEDAPVALETLAGCVAELR